MQLQVLLPLRYSAQEEGGPQTKKIFLLAESCVIGVSLRGKLFVVVVSFFSFVVQWELQ